MTQQIKMAIEDQAAEAIKEFAEFSGKTVTELLKESVVLRIKNRVANDSHAVTAPFFGANDLETVCAVFSKWLAAKRRSMSNPGPRLSNPPKEPHFDGLVDADGLLVNIIRDVDGSIVNEAGVNEYLATIARQKELREAQRESDNAGK